MKSNMILHRGAEIVDREALDMVTIPPGTSTWYPVGHGHVVDRTKDALQQAGFSIEREQLAITRGGDRFFGTLDLRSPLSPGVSLAVGIRNSIDKSLPIAFAAGSRVFVCDNLSFSSEVVISRKHTRFGDERFTEALSLAVQSLGQFRDVEAARIGQFQAKAITDIEAESTILRSFEHGIVSNRLLPKVIQEWRSPSYAEFKPRTLWSLFNCFTTIMGDRQKSNPQQFAYMTIRLTDMLSGRAVAPVDAEYSAV